MLIRASARSRKALRCSTAQKGPKSNTSLLRNFPVYASLGLGANEGMRHQADAKRGRLVFVSPFGRAEQHRALRERATARINI